MNVYSVDGVSIVHTTNVDVHTNKISNPVYLVQYDDRLPILAVTIYNNGQPYTIPDSATARLRVGKPDNTCVNVSALGMSSDKHTLYFEITKQMTTCVGTLHPTVEIKVGERVAHPSLLTFIIAKNAIQDGVIESTTEYKEFFDYIEQVKQIASDLESVKKLVGDINVSDGSGGTTIDLSGYADRISGIENSIGAIDSNLEQINSDLDKCKENTVTVKYQNGKIYGRTDENGEWIEIETALGKDGVSPTITVSGSTIIVTDAEGVHSYDLSGTGAGTGTGEDGTAITGKGAVISFDGDKIIVEDEDGKHEYEIAHKDEDARSRLDRIEQLLQNSDVKQQASGTDKGAKLGTAREVELSVESGGLSLTWLDPEDTLNDDGEISARWGGTKILWNIGKEISGVDDADAIVIDSTIRHDGVYSGAIGVAKRAAHFYFAIFPYTVSGVYSDGVFVDKTIADDDIVKPDPIDDAKVTKVSATSCKITFTKPKEATMVRLLYKKGSSPKSKSDDGVICIDNFTSGTVVKDLDDSATYYFRLNARASDGTMVKGDTFAFTTELDVVSFADGTWKQISKMLDAHYAGTIDIADYWNIGDEKTIHISQIDEITMTDTYRTTMHTQPEQDQIVTIIGISQDTLSTPIGVRTKAAITFQLKDCLSRLDNAVNADTGGGLNWQAKAIRTWLITSFFDGLPSKLQSILKATTHPFAHYSSGACLSTDHTSIFLLSKCELTGVEYVYQYYKTVYEGNEQYPYYENGNNRIKHHNGTPIRWWTRSGASANLEIVDENGEYTNVPSGGSKNLLGISPAFTM